MIDVPEKKQNIDSFLDKRRQKSPPAGILYKQFDPDQDRQNVNLIVFLQEFLEKSNFEKKNQQIPLSALKMSSAFYICCIYSNALQTIFFMEANNIYLDQTGSKVFAKKATTDQSTGLCFTILGQ